MQALVSAERMMKEGKGMMGLSGIWVIRATFQHDTHGRCGVGLQRLACIWLCDSRLGSYTNMFSPRLGVNDIITLL